ncbi:MAG: tripartite tricarboxylate transporter substrate binding protein [Reyranella sp.]|nr:tripartite tricarboxylate transporter substrate binding protein [Reyranella sp.]MDP3161733.1 tripartite tricarboxylate transporter substrate binding protein [Reyranella sp.]
MINRRLFSAGLLAAPFANPAVAQTWQPSGPIKMVVAYPAGGPTDVIARIVAADIAGPLGQQVVVENVSGGAGSIGTRAVAKAKPDGLTITFGNNQTHGNNMFMLKEPGYDAVKDFAPLAGAGAFEHVFVVRNDLPAKTIQEVIALAKAKPGELNYGSTGIGSGSHLSTELFMARTGIKMTHVPYRGAAPLVQDLMGGRIDISNSTLPSVLAQIKAGQIRAVAIGSAKRNPKLPDVATLEEQGVTGANASSWAAFFAPAATPQPVLDRLSGEIMKSLNKPEVVEKIDKLGFTVEPRDPAQFRPYQVQEIATWVKIAQDAGIQPGE